MEVLGGREEGKKTITEDIAEWDCGDYEGLVTEEIRAHRKEKGLERISLGIFG